MIRDEGVIVTGPWGKATPDVTDVAPLHQCPRLGCALTRIAHGPIQVKAVLVARAVQIDRGGLRNALLVNEVPAVPDHEPSHVFDERQRHPEHLRPAWLNLAIRRLRQGPAEQKTAAVIAQLDRVGRAPSQRPPRPGRIMERREPGYAVVAIDAQAQEQGFRLPRWSSGTCTPGGSDGKPPSLR